jgi:hypothetical protein
MDGICNSVRAVALAVAYLPHNQGNPCKNVSWTIEIISVLLIVLLRAGSTTAARAVVKMDAFRVCSGNNILLNPHGLLSSNRDTRWLVLERRFHQVVRHSPKTLSLQIELPGMEAATHPDLAPHQVDLVHPSEDSAPFDSVQSLV